MNSHPEDNQRVVIPFAPREYAGEERRAEDPMEREVHWVSQIPMQHKILANADHDERESKREKPTAMRVEVLL